MIRSDATCLSEIPYRIVMRKQMTAAAIPVQARCRR